MSNLTQPSLPQLAHPYPNASQTHPIPHILSRRVGLRALWLVASVKAQETLNDSDHLSAQNIEVNLFNLMDLERFRKLMQFVSV